jgi:hypothetical protein
MWQSIHSLDGSARAQNSGPAWPSIDLGASWPKTERMGIEKAEEKPRRSRRREEAEGRKEANGNESRETANPRAQSNNICVIISVPPIRGIAKIRKFCLRQIRGLLYFVGGGDRSHPRLKGLKTID